MPTRKTAPVDKAAESSRDALQAPSSETTDRMIRSFPDDAFVLVRRIVHARELRGQPNATNGAVLADALREYAARHPDGRTISLPHTPRGDFVAGPVIRRVLDALALPDQPDRKDLTRWGAD